MTPIERIQTSLQSADLKAIEARLENLLEQAARRNPAMPISSTNCWRAKSTRAGHDTCRLV